MREFLKPGEFKFGICASGVVVGIKPIIKIGDIKYAGADITMQWSADVDTITGLMVAVFLEIEWLQFAENIIIPFNMRNDYQRGLTKKICEDGRLFFVDINLADKAGHGVGTGICVEINKSQVLEWLEIEEKGGTIKNWRNH